MNVKNGAGGYHVAIVGATGAVGRVMTRLLEERAFPVSKLTLLASARSAGSVVEAFGGSIVVQELGEGSFEGVDLALFSAGGGISEAFGPIAAAAGALVVDNSSAFRRDDDVPLVVPEVNAAAAERAPRGIIANPNCSTAQMVLVLQPLHAAATLKRVIVSTYQSVSGAGQKGVDELMAGTRAHLSGEEEVTGKFAYPIAFNALPHIDKFQDNGYTREEMKMVWETRKIMGLPDLQVSATCVRVPVIRSHSEAVTVELERPLSADEARALLSDAPGVVVIDNPTEDDPRYPLPRDAADTNATYVGRVRVNPDRPDTLHMWVVSDNLYKGAALNAIQILEALAASGTLRRG